MNRPEKHSRSLERAAFFLVILVTLLSYGTIWSRGGYADDFNFLAYSSGKGYLEAVVGWQANARFSQAIVMPLLMQGLAGDTPLDFHWEVFHAIGIGAFLLCILFFNGILKTTGASWILRVTSCLVFAIYPIKNEALLWPSTIVGYVIALMVFLGAVWFYFATAKKQKESAYSLLITGFLFLFALFFIEQLAPLLVLVVFFRLILFGRRPGSVLANGFMLTSLFAIFIWANYFSAASEKLHRYSGETVSLVSNILNVLQKSFAAVTVYPARIVFDPYYWPSLKGVLLSPAFWLACVTLIVLGWILIKGIGASQPGTAKSRISPWRFFLGGGLIWVAAFSPFMVISYYLPDRVYFIPLLGLSLMAGAVMELIVSSHRWWMSRLLVVLLVSAGCVFVLINQYSERDFEKQWNDQKKVMETLAGMERELEPGDVINLVNFPKEIGPAPEFVNWFAFNGMLKWMFPGLDLKGYTQRGFFSIFPLPGIQETTGATVLSLKKNEKLLVWLDDTENLRKVDALRLGAVASSKASTDDKSKEQLIGELVDIGLKSAVAHGFQITIDRVLLLDEARLCVLSLGVRSVKPGNWKTRLIVHARMQDGSMRPYDLTLTKKDVGTAGNNDWLRAEVQVSDCDKLKEVRVGLLKEDQQLFTTENTLKWIIRP